MRRLLLIPVLVLMLAACGGGDDDNGDDGNADGGNADNSGAGSTDNGDSSGEPAGVILVIGADTYEFDSLGALGGCARVGGQVSGSGEITGEEVTMGFTIPPEDWETNDRFDDPPRVSMIDRGSDPAVRWNGGDLAGTVDSYSIDDDGASGTVTWVSERLSGSTDFVSETVQGTFDINCGG